jgi:glycosyltransferase involved in cell wall biosynthesis
VTPALGVVLPGNVDDPASPSGGNRYDRRVCDELRSTRELWEIAAAGSWPRPTAAQRAKLARRLAALPDGTDVLLDGLVACAVPEVLESAARRLRLVVVVHLALGDETGLASQEAAELTALERRALHAADAVVTTSAGAARHLSERHDLPADRVHVAAPGVDPAAPATAVETGERLLCVAAVTPRKAQDVLVEALAGLQELTWGCVCVGALDRAPAFAKRLVRANDRVRFVGPRSGQSLADAYANADLLVLPSRSETYGMVVTEALARAVPVLATAVDGVPEALGTAPDGTPPGMLVPPGDPAALAAALRAWLTDGGLRQRLRTAAAGRRETLRGWDATARDLAEVLAR